MIGASTPVKPLRPPPTPRRRRRRPKRAVSSLGESTRVQILKSAAVAFRKFGYHGTTVTRIASTLRMKKGNLYYYFRNKEEILFACHQYSLDCIQALMDEILERDEAPADKLRAVIVALVHAILDELHGTTLFIDLEALTPPHFKAVVVRRDRIDRGMRQIVADGVATGGFRACDAQLLSYAILGAVNWIPRWFKPEARASSQEVAERFAAFLVDGLRPTS